MPTTPSQGSYSGKKLHPDDEIVIPQDDLNTFSWEVDFDYQLFETDNWPETASRLPNDAASGDVDDYVTEDERNSAHEDESSSERNESDVTENET